VIAHKTFHRYVVRQKAGTAQSQYDKQGGHAKSAGAQIRRHNEQALAQVSAHTLGQEHKFPFVVAFHGPLSLSQSSGNLNGEIKIQRTGLLGSVMFDKS